MKNIKKGVRDFKDRMRQSNVYLFGILEGDRIGKDEKEKWKVLIVKKRKIGRGKNK